MKQFSYQADDDTLRLIAELAEWWGMATTRFNTPVIRKCVEKVHAQEKARRELAEFDKLSNEQALWQKSES